MLYCAEPRMKQRQVELEPNVTVNEAAHRDVFCAQVPPGWD